MSMPKIGLVHHEACSTVDSLHVLLLLLNKKVLFRLPDCLQCSRTWFHVPPLVTCNCFL